MLDDMYALDFEDVLVNEYLEDLCVGNVNDSLIDYVDDIHEEIEDNIQKKREKNYYH